MINNLEKSKKLWFMISFLALTASITGVFNQNIYSKVVADNVLPGVISQDIMTILISFSLIFLSLRINKNDIKKLIISLSFILYIIYGYGIYVIEQLYTPLYLLYIAIVSLSFWTLIYSFINMDKNEIENIKLNKAIRYLTISFLIFIPILFYSIWISELIPLIREGLKLEFMFSVYILDMVFVLPAFLITTYLLIKRNFFGYILAPLLFFKAFTLLFSVGLGGLIKPLFGQASVKSENLFYITLSIIFLTLAVLNYLSLDFIKKK